MQTTFAAVAPATPEDDHDAHDGAMDDNVNLNALFEAWSYWSRTRRFYAPAPPSGTILGKLSSKTRAFSTGGPDAPCNMDLAALHLAILGQPSHALDTMVFYAYYVHRVNNIKVAAGELGIGRAHFFRLVKGCCTRVHAASQVIAQHAGAQRDALPHYVGMVGEVA